MKGRLRGRIRVVLGPRAGMGAAARNSRGVRWLAESCKQCTTVLRKPLGEARRTPAGERLVRPAYSRPCRMHHSRPTPSNKDRAAAAPRQQRLIPFRPTQSEHYLTLAHPKLPISPTDLVAASTPNQRRPVRPGPARAALPRPTVAPDFLHHSTAHAPRASWARANTAPLATARTALAVGARAVHHGARASRDPVPRWLDAAGRRPARGARTAALVRQVAAAERARTCPRARPQSRPGAVLTAARRAAACAAPNCSLRLGKSAVLTARTRGVQVRAGERLAVGKLSMRGAGAVGPWRRRRCLRRARASIPGGAMLEAKHCSMRQCGQMRAMPLAQVLLVGAAPAAPRRWNGVCILKARPRAWRPGEFVGVHRGPDRGTVASLFIFECVGGR